MTTGHWSWTIARLHMMSTNALIHYIDAALLRKRGAVAAGDNLQEGTPSAPLFTCRLLLKTAAQMPKFRFQFSYARFSGETSCLLFAQHELRQPDDPTLSSS